MISGFKQTNKQRGTCYSDIQLWELYFKHERPEVQGQKQTPSSGINQGSGGTLVSRKMVYRGK